MRSSLLVMLGAFFWATDTLFRHPTVQKYTPLTVVTLEHFFGVILCGFLLWIFYPRDFFLKSRKAWFSAFFVGLLGSAVATLLFTASFQFLNPNVSILIQKIQPIFVLIMGRVFLKEKLARGFWIWALGALVSATFMTHPDLAYGLPKTEHIAIGGTFAFLAAFFWAASTVIGKTTLQEESPYTLTFWRFFFGFIPLMILVSINPQAKIEIEFLKTDTDAVRSLFMLAAVSGVLAVSLYYKGLRNIPAGLATILELTFPLSALWLNWKFLGLKLTHAQILSSLVLMGCLFQLSRIQGEGQAGKD